MGLLLIVLNKAVKYFALSDFTSLKECECLFLLYRWLCFVFNCIRFLGEPKALGGVIAATGQGVSWDAGQGVSWGAGQGVSWGAGQGVSWGAGWRGWGAGQAGLGL